MSKVLLELSLSPDGFVAGPNIGPDAPLGIGGERLHEWMFAEKSPTESETFLNARLLDEIRLHLVPIFLVARSRLLDGVRTDVDLAPREVQEEPKVTHLVYEVGGER